MLPCRISLACVVAAMLAVPLMAQREWHTWPFGDGHGISFAYIARVLTTPRQIERSPVRQSEGIAAISEACTGALIFSSDGYSVYDFLGSTLPNGSGLLGDQSATQAALFLPHPADTSLYFLFTAPDRASGVAKPNPRYSWNLIDRRLNQGRGDVVRKNVILAEDASERLCAVLYPDGLTYWVLTMDTDTTVFRAYRVDQSGLNPIPVVSEFPFPSHRVGNMKISPNGKLMAIASPMYGVELFDFDINSGRVSNRRVLITDDNRSRIAASVFYGLAFSPNSLMLYASSRGVASSVVQFNCSLGSTDLIGLSAVEVHRQALLDVYSWAFPLELAPNGYIYIGANTDFHAITEPDKPFPDCSIRLRALSLLNGRVNDGLPNIPAGVWNLQSQRLICQPPLPRFVARDVCVGEPVVFTDSSQGFPSQWFWQFPGGNPNQSSGVKPPPVRYEVAGVYVVALRVQNDFGSALFTDSVVVHPPPGVFAGRDASACLGQFVQLDARTNGTRYAWQPGAAVSDSTSLSPVVLVDQDSLVLVLTAWSEQACVARDTIVVRARAAAAVVPADTAICAGETVFLTASGGNNIEWFTPDGTLVNRGSEYFVQPTESIVYTVVVFADGCVDSAFVSVVVHPVPVIVASADTSICPGDSVQLFAAGGFEYLWSPVHLVDSPTSSSPWVRPSTTTAFRVTAISEFGCSFTKEVVVHVSSQGSLKLTPDTIICKGASVKLRANGAHDVVWLTASGVVVGTDPEITVTPSTSTTFFCTTRNENCPLTDSVFVQVVSQPIAEIVQLDTACVGQAVRLIATGATRYEWYNDAGLRIGVGSVLMITPIEATRIQAVGFADYGCTDTTTILVVVHPRQNVVLLMDVSPKSIAPGEQVRITLRPSLPAATRATVTATMPWNALAVTSVANATDVVRSRQGNTDVYTFVLDLSSESPCVIEATALLQPSPSILIGARASARNTCVQIDPTNDELEFRNCEGVRRAIRFIERATIGLAHQSAVVSVPAGTFAIVECWTILGQQLWQHYCTEGHHRFDAATQVPTMIRLTDHYGSTIHLIPPR